MKIPHESFQAYIRAFEILNKARPNDTFVLAASHDIILTQVRPDELSPNDLEEIKELGFHVSHEYDNSGQLCCFV